ncbi:MAG: DedA family protein [bacterium]|nr:DedA family protein [bacterium]
MNLQDVFQLLTHYQYLILFPISIVEGPIITVIAGFLTTLGIMKWFIVYFIVVLGDIFGDALAYATGRVGGDWLAKYSAFFRVTPEKLEQAKKFFDTHHHKALFLSKVFYGVGTAGLMAAGMLKIRYSRFMLTCFVISLLQAAILLTLGIVFGRLYVEIGKYLDYYTAGMSIFALAVIVIFILYKTKGLRIFGK